MKKSTQRTFLIIGLTFGAVCLLAAASKPVPRKRRRRQNIQTADFEAATAPEASNGLSIKNERLQIYDWNLWIKFAAHETQRAVNEGATKSDHVTARLFYACFPDRVWPPPQESPMLPVYQEVVATIERNIDKYLRSNRVEEAQHRGLRLVED